jgi:GntR family transcriptional regulator
MLDKTSAIPLHEQLDKILRSDLKNHKWGPDQKIPSENELAQLYGLSRMTVRAVVNHLVNDGLLYRVQGKGTFVSPIKLDVSTNRIQSFREQIEEKGYQYHMDIISCENIKTTAYLREMLCLPENVVELLYVYRLTYVEGEPTCIHKAFILPEAAKFVTKENLESSSLFELLKYCGYSTDSIVENIKTDFPTDSDCKLLKVGKWHPLLIVSDVHKTSNGVPFILNEFAFRGEKVNINVEVRDKRAFLFVDA